MTFHREIMNIYFGTTYFTLICHFGNEKGTGAMICPSVVCSIVAGMHLSAIGQFFVLVPRSSLRSLCES